MAGVMEASGTATRLRYTEQLASLDRTDSGADRERGCRGLLDKLDEELQRPS